MRCLSIVAASIVCLMTLRAVAQNGGTINVGNSTVGQSFVLHKLTCDILPKSPSAENAGGRWRPVGAKTWYRSADPVFLPPATYTLQFKDDVPGWTAPTADKTVVLDGDKMKKATYVKKE